VIDAQAADPAATAVGTTPAGTVRAGHSTVQQTQAEFEALLAPILQMAYGTAVRLTRSRTEAEDLVQDTALLAFRAFHSFERGTNFKAWFFRILTNAFYSRHRKDKHEKANLSTEDVPALYLYSRVAESGLPGREEDPASAIMDRIDSEQVAEALEALPTEYRVVATLYFIEDFSYQQIAEVVGCPVGTVRSRLHRGRRMLQKALWEIARERGIGGEKSRN
jgi:RNA polymerase sigma-70 factor (ECF subfamily)